MAVETGIPKLDAPFVQPNERAPGAARIIAIPWYMLLVELWRRTGSGSGIAPTMVQTGMVLEYAGATAPAGYLMADGTAYLATDYPNLFGVIGYTFGGAAGTFNVPNRRNRFAVGAGGAIAPNLGDVGGAATVTIAQVNLPAYALTVTDPGHTHTQNAHTHTQNSHNHTQDTHTHTQNSHNHTQDSHNHTQDSHNHALAKNTTETSGTIAAGEVLAYVRDNPDDKDYRLTPTTGTPNVGIVGSTTATNQATTATNQATTATNQNTVATNQAATATNQNTTATNNSNTTGISVDSGGSGTALASLPPYIGMNFIIKT